MIPPLSVEDWDRRFRIQSRWSQEIRQHTRQKYPPSPFSKVLEIGCGTGAILSEFDPIPGGLVAGIDLQFERLDYFRKHLTLSNLVVGNGYHLPFNAKCFEQAFCHYFLLWVNDPLSVLLEIRRVLIKGGIFFIYSEPDYGGRIEFPVELESIKAMQIDSLQYQGADPFIGRKITNLLEEAGFHSITTGVISWSSKNALSEDEFASEWEIIEHDNEDRISFDRLRELRNIDRNSRMKKTRVSFVPVFYGWGVA